MDTDGQQLVCLLTAILRREEKQLSPCYEAAAGITKRFSHKLSKAKQNKLDKQQRQTHAHAHAHTTANKRNVLKFAPASASIRNQEHLRYTGTCCVASHRNVSSGRSGDQYTYTLPRQLSPPHSQKNHFSYNTKPSYEHTECCKHLECFGKTMN